MAEKNQSGIRELMALPIIMGGLSLLMWFSLPTKQEVRDKYAADIEQREMWLRQAVADLPATGRNWASGCGITPDPSPVWLQGDEFATNTEFVTVDDLKKLGIDSPLRGDKGFYLRGELGYLMYWRRFPPSGVTQRLGQDRIDEEVLQPLATRYLVLYGVEELNALGALRVDAFVYDFASTERLCGLSARYFPPPRGEAGDHSGDHAKRFLADLAGLTGGAFSEERHW